MISAAPNPQRETHLCVRGQLMIALPEGALWWRERRTLIVSDLHLEKGSSFATGGQMLPPYDTSATLAIVERLCAQLNPERVISLGDSFHDKQSELRLSPEDAARIKTLTSQFDWVWVEGNHDPDPPAHLGGQAAKALTMENVTFRHEPTGVEGEIAGHLHPCAKMLGRVRSLRRRCFVTDGKRLIMPALGAFTGGLNVLHAAFDEAFPEGTPMVFMMGKDCVVAVDTKRLIPDRRRQPSEIWRL